MFLLSDDYLNFRANPCRQSSLVHLTHDICYCRHYHGKLTAEEREQVQSEWTNGEVQVIVATLAFGMGTLCLWCSTVNG